LGIQHRQHGDVDVPVWDTVSVAFFFHLLLM
jgi:hypothetical protein